MELPHPFLHLRFGIAPRLVHIALGIVFITLRAVSRRLGAREPPWRNTALDIGIISIGRFQRHQFLGTSDEGPAMDLSLLQIVGFLSVESLGDLFFGEDNNSNLILLCEIERDRLRWSWLVGQKNGSP